jgi:hypothetical protein
MIDQQIPMSRSRRPRSTLPTEKAALVEWLRRHVDEALTDQRPSIPAREVFRRLRDRHAERTTSEADEKA